MRYVLTIIAVALVAVMSAALVAPMLIDWSAHRAEIEARLRAITGANVSLTGPVEVRLLPTPYLALGAGSLSAPEGPQAEKKRKVVGSSVLPALEWIMTHADMVKPPNATVEPFAQSGTAVDPR